jgi:hypothetical protein
VSVLTEYAEQLQPPPPTLRLGQEPPLGPGESAVVVSAGRVVRRDRLGGLIHEYAQVASGDRISGTHTIIAASTTEAKPQVNAMDEVFGTYRSRLPGTDALR